MAISTTWVVKWTLYKKGGSNHQRLITFLNKILGNKVNKLILHHFHWILGQFEWGNCTLKSIYLFDGIVLLINKYSVRYFYFCNNYENQWILSGGLRFSIGWIGK